ncbi:MAG: cadherin-like domain-containing protein, partial [Candidatus Latescibacteria bacterium]|nr:cadherin-like domain-containing protein [Candidatus Latescibacterota bacterium]
WQVLSTDFSGATVSLPATLTTDATFSGGGVLSNGFSITGDIIVAPDGHLELDANTVDATGDLTVTISNTPGDGLIMNHNADVLIIGGNAVFTTVSQHGSAASDGNFTHGVLRVRGNFTQTKSGASAGANVFVSTGTKVVFDGSGPQAVSFFQAGAANSRIDDVDIENTSGVSFNTSVYVMGQLTMKDGASLSQVNPLSTFFGARLPIIPSSATYAVANTHTSGQVVLDHSLSMVEPENSLFVEPNSTLTLNGHTMDIGGDLTVTISNTVGDGLIMTDPNDEFTVNGHAFFTTSSNHGSAFSDGNFTDGTLRLRGHFTQTRSGASASINSFVSTGTRVVFDGTGTQNVFVANPGVSSSRFHDLSIENTSPSSFVLLTPILVAGQLISPPEVRPIVGGNGMSMTVNGGLDVDDLILVDVAITVNGGVIDRFNHVTFQNYSPTDVQFVINHTDMSATFVGLEFLTEPEFAEGPAGYYLLANDTDGGSPATLTLLNSSPVDGSGFTDMSGGFIVDWSSALYAVDDFVSTLEDTSVTISVLSNDMNPLSGTLSVTGSTNGANGSIVLEPGLTQITYHPDPDFHGTDTFTYTVTDGTTSDSGVVTITVVSDQDPILVATPIPVAFGPAALGSSVIRSLFVKNAGTDALHVTDINHTELAVSDTMFFVAPGDSLEVEVTFTPGSIGPLGGDIEILSNDPATPTFLVAVTGAGTPVGDVTGDELVNILDIISLVNVLIGEQDPPEPGSSAYLRLDVNGDGDLNVLDVVTLINIILDVPLMKEVGTPLGPVSLEIVPGPSPQDHLVQLPLHFVNDGPIAGLQFSLRYDQSLVQFGSPEPSERLQDMQWAYQDLDGLLQFIVYSPEGSSLDMGTGPLFYLPVTPQPDGADAEVSIENVVVSDQSGHSVSVLQTGVHRLASLPATFELKPNRPNPFNPTTSISYDVPQQTRIRITVYNLLGQMVTRLVDEIQAPGRYTAVWNGHNSAGHQVASGVYIYRMSSGTGYTQNRRMMLLK